MAFLWLKETGLPIELKEYMKCLEEPKRFTESRKHFERVDLSDYLVQKFLQD